VKKRSACLGQSLIEVVVAVGVMSLLLVSLLSLISLSIKNSRLAKDRTLAVQLAQEGVELMRAYRDYSWSEFNAAVGNVYVLPLNWTVEDGLSTPGCDETDFIIDAFFSRCVELSSGGIDGVEAGVTVSWQEGTQLKQTVQTTRLSLWER
jgi:Tfp pilus assembly protein PilV